jgi:hypothetical protein
MYCKVRVLLFIVSLVFALTAIFFKENIWIFSDLVSQLIGGLRESPFNNKGLLTEREVCTVKYQTEVL